MNKERLVVARSIISKTVSEMKKVDTLPKFSEMPYDEIERNLYTVVSHVCGHGEAVESGKELNSAVATIVANVKDEVFAESLNFTHDDWAQVYTLACELISQTTLQVRQK